MCWVSKTVKSTKIAKNDIEVFKIVTLLDYAYYNNGLEAKVCPIFYRDILYGYYNRIDKRFNMNQNGHFKEGPIKINVCYDGDLKFGYSEYYSCRKAFHSYKSDMTSVVLDENGLITVKHPLGERTRYGSSVRNNLIIMECVIPKGANYAVNEEGECVSDELVVKGLKEIK